MAKLLPQVLVVFEGDRPEVTIVGSVPHLSVDGGRIGPALAFPSISEYEAWLDHAVHDLQLRKAAIREQMHDDAYDALRAGSAV